MGLIVGMTLARESVRREGSRSATRQIRLAGLDPETVWDAGLFAIISCFVASRLLLILRDPLAFIHYPLLVLGLPSLTIGGMALASVMLWAYLRRKGVPLLALMDIFCAPAAVFAAFLELGHALDGSEVGMPSALPWAVRDPWDFMASSVRSSVPLRVHPVAFYGVAVSLLIAIVLWRFAARAGSGGAGSAAALALMLGGAAAFGLDMLTQPLLVALDLWIEPGQWVALFAMVAGTVLWTRSASRAARVTAPPAVISAYPEPSPTEMR